MRPLEGQRCLPLHTTLTNNTFPPSGRIASLSGRIVSLSFPPSGRFVSLEPSTLQLCRLGSKLTVAGEMSASCT